MPTQIDLLKRVIYQGLGAAASVMGNEFTVYRLNNSTTGAVVSSGSLLYISFPCITSKVKSKVLTENEIFSLQAYEAKCDGNKLQYGDVLVQQSDGTQYCVADVRDSTPIRVVLMRTENNCSIEKGRPSAGAADDQPSSGFVAKHYADNEYGGMDIADRYRVALDAGYYAMLPPNVGTMATVPCAIQPLNKVTESHKPEIPTPFPGSRFIGWIPYTRGYMPNELEIIKASQNDSYEILEQYSSGLIGLTGVVCIMRKINV